VSNGADTSGDSNERVTPDRLRRLPSRLLGHAAQHADRIATQGLARLDAHKWYYAVLVSLDEFGPASQAGLSRRTGIYSSDLVAVTNELVGRGLVERTPDPADRRRNVVTLSPDGRSYLAQLDDVIATIQDELLAPLTQSEREQLIQLLIRLVDHHGSAWPRPRGGDGSS
jgi:DNA-binding MarR family transcriptional regulator